MLISNRDILIFNLPSGPRVKKYQLRIVAYATRTATPLARLDKLRPVVLSNTSFTLRTRTTGKITFGIDETTIHA